MSRRPYSLGTFRFHIVLTAALVVLSFSGTAAFLTFVPLISRFGAGSPGSDAHSGLADYLLFLHGSFWPVVAGSVLASIASGMILFERMRSPLRRLRSTYVQISDGEMPAPISIRKFDYLRDETADLNRMLEAIGRRRSDERLDLEIIRQAIQELAACDLPAKGAGAIAEIHGALSRLQQDGARHEA